MNETRNGAPRTAKEALLDRFSKADKHGRGLVESALAEERRLALCPHCGEQLSVEQEATRPLPDRPEPPCEIRESHEHNGVSSTGPCWRNPMYRADRPEPSLNVQALGVALNEALAQRPEGDWVPSQSAPDVARAYTRALGR